MNMTALSSAAPAASGVHGLRLALAIAFLVAVTWLTWLGVGHLSGTLVVATVIGVYMAMNIGANDVANNVGPAVGGRVMTMRWAIVVAALFEVLGAVLAGGEVTGTIKGGIIDPASINDPQSFVWLMMAALLAGALWLNFATAIGAPVSTTHSIVGGVLGAGIAAAGWEVANWAGVGRIAASWVISPLMGGILAAALLYLIKRSITYQRDLMQAARRAVPILIGFMAWAFTSYLLLKGLSKVVKVSPLLAMTAGLAMGVATMLFLGWRIGRRAPGLSNDKEGVNRLFAVPLIFAAALMSFAHGSNDVSNAIGPLAAVHDVLVGSPDGGDSAAIPFWILLVGALGIAVGLALYGPRLIRTVGSEITDMDPMRAYCIAVAAAVTVILASHLGLPVSSTHVTIGAIFGVGFLREYLKANYQRIIAEIEEHHRTQAHGLEVVEAFLLRFEAAPVAEKDRMLRDLKKQGRAGKTHISKQERKGLRRVHRRELVKRAVMMRVVAAWLVTVPASALIAAIAYYAIRGAMLP
ncbi:MAG: inorganic phosphate transporter [Lysobacteraceae bacterium]